MALPDENLREELRQLVSETGRRKDSAETRFGWAAFFFSVTMTGIAVWAMTTELGLSWWLQIILGLIVFVVSFIGIYVFGSSAGQGHVDRAAKSFKERFTRETGDYDKALALLRGSKSDTEIEKDLLKALGLDVIFADEGATHLLGEFDKVRAEPGSDPGKAATAAEPGAGSHTAAAPDPAASGPPDYIPLDPYERADEAAETPCGPAEGGSLTNKQ